MVSWILVLAAVALVGAYAFERSRRRTRPMPGGLDTTIHLPHEQDFELYHNALSLCSKKARVCLAELGIEYRGHHVDLIETGAYENIGRAFLQVNPAGLVPVLVHRGHPIYESHEQIRYAADHAPPGAPSLLPGAEDEAEMQRWVDRASLVGDDPMQGMAESAGNCVPGLTVPLFAAMIDAIPTWRILEGLLFHRLKVRPVLFLVLKAVGLERLHRLPPARRAIEASARHMDRHLDALETWLETRGGPWILGDPYTLADVSWVVIFDRLREADWIDRFLGSEAAPARKRVRDYWDALRARRSYAAAIGAHGHPTVHRGTERIRRAKAADAALAAFYERAGRAADA